MAQEGLLLLPLASSWGRGKWALVLWWLLLLPLRAVAAQLPVALSSRSSREGPCCWMTVMVVVLMLVLMLLHPLAMIVAQMTQGMIWVMKDTVVVMTMLTLTRWVAVVKQLLLTAMQ